MIQCMCVEEIPETKGDGTMEKYVVDGRIISKEEADKIAKRSMEALELFEAGDLDALSDIKFVIPLDVAIAVAKRKAVMA